MDEVVPAILDAIGEALGERPGFEGTAPVGGGSIHRAARLRAGGRSYFVKTNGLAAAPMFAAEAAGLAALGNQADIAVPAVVARGEDSERRVEPKRQWGAMQ